MPKKGEERKTVAVFFGGKSFEHEISVLTGVFALNALKGDEYDLLPVYISMDGRMYTSEEMYDVKTFTVAKNNFTEIIFLKNTVCALRGKKIKPIKAVTCALNCCHGGWGEDGGLAAYTEFCSIPITSPDKTLSSVFMDKTVSKPLIAGMGIPSARYVTLFEGDWSRDRGAAERRIKEELGLPVIIKPARLGSSVGIGVVKEERALAAAIERAFTFDDALLIEEYLPDKRDINCAVYACGGEIYVSECEEPLSGEEILSFREKYLAGNERLVRFPAEIPKTQAEEMKEIAEKIYKTLRFTGMVRVDFLLCGEKVYFNELNTVPGSLAYYLFTQKISGAGKLFAALIREAIEKKGEKTPHPAGILQKITLKGGAKAPTS